MAQKGDEFKEVRLPAKVVNGLLQLNEKRRSKQFDLPFLKALLVGFCTVKKIQEHGSIDEEIVNVAKGNILDCILVYSLQTIHKFIFLELFEWRIAEDEGRLNNFEQLLAIAVDSIKEFKV